MSEALSRNNEKQFSSGFMREAFRAVGRRLTAVSETAVRFAKEHPVCTAVGLLSIPTSIIFAGPGLASLSLGLSSFVYLLGFFNDYERFTTKSLVSSVSVLALSVALVSTCVFVGKESQKSEEAAAKAYVAAACGGGYAKVSYQYKDYFSSWGRRIDSAVSAEILRSGRQVVIEGGPSGLFGVKKGVETGRVFLQDVNKSSRLIAIPYQVPSLQ